MYFYVFFPVSVCDFLAILKSIPIPLNCVIQPQNGTGSCITFPPAGCDPRRRLWLNLIDDKYVTDENSKQPNIVQNRDYSLS